MTKRSVLVTGASGFIGQNLLEVLQNRNWDVFATSRSDESDRKLARLGARGVRCDLVNAASLSPLEMIPELDAVVHLAGCVAGTEQELKRVNQQGTNNLVNTLRKRHKPPIFVLVSSVAAGGPSPRNQPRLEHQPPTPISNYGRSKLEGERAAVASHAYMPVSIVRPGIVFGPGDVEFNLILKAMNRLFWNPMIGLGNQPLSMLDVRDLVQLLLRVIDDGERVNQATDSGDAKEGIGVYHASSMEPLTLRALGRLFYRVAHKPALPFPLPPSLGMALGLGSELYCKWTRSKSTLNRDKIREAKAPGWFVSSAKAQKQLGWTTNKPIENSMMDWIQFALENKLL